MTSVRFVHHIDDLADDLERNALTTKPRMAAIMTEALPRTVATMRGLAKESSGPHGKNYFKRVGGDLLSPLSAEIGPSGDVENNAVGAGWRHGQNTDSARTADVAGPKLASDVRDLLDELFW